MTDTLPNLVSCRDCLQPVGASALVCPHCGAPQPGNHSYRRGYEYKSKAMLFGLPLVHVAFGRDQNRKLRVATGIIAVGQFGRGVICIAQFGVGVIFIGHVGVGLLAVAQVAVGLAVLGQFSVGLYAIGQIPVALIWAKGQLPIVWR